MCRSFILSPLERVKLLSDDRVGVVRTLSDVKSRAVTGFELVKRGSCTPDCLLADPATECTCRCIGRWHGGLSNNNATPNWRW